MTVLTLSLGAGILGWLYLRPLNPRLFPGNRTSSNGYPYSCVLLNVSLDTAYQAICPNEAFPDRFENSKADTLMLVVPGLHSLVTSISTCTMTG